MKTVDIKGKAYVQVNERIMYFRENYPDHTLSTEIVTLQDGVCVMKSSVYNKDGVLVSNGHAYEKEGSTFINKTSYIENCETSAIGRALGNLGIGIDTSVASAEEVENAIAQQNTGLKQTLVQKDKIIKLVQEGHIDLESVKKYYKVNSVDELDHLQSDAVITKGKKNKVKNNE